MTQIDRMRSALLAILELSRADRPDIFQVASDALLDRRQFNRVTHGKFSGLTAASRKHGIPRARLVSRVMKGWTLERAICTPPVERALTATLFAKPLREWGRSLKDQESPL